MINENGDYEIKISKVNEEAEQIKRKKNYMLIYYM